MTALDGEPAGRRGNKATELGPIRDAIRRGRGDKATGARHAEGAHTSSAVTAALLTLARVRAVAPAGDVTGRGSRTRTSVLEPEPATSSGPPPALDGREPPWCPPQTRQGRTAHIRTRRRPVLLGMLPGRARVTCPGTAGRTPTSRPRRRPDRPRTGSSSGRRTRAAWAGSSVPAAARPATVAGFARISQPPPASLPTARTRAARWTTTAHA
ncbi:hypothetical protein [Streptomyces sp. TLI_185]|uniref:hypothetical protein n=1 Tax=Streptomyces sp. TLI_185 TaxID=2485151 RepID=UPI000F50F76E|nr:hypothetical protein [Streptomyces sp. TLI_185]